MLCSTPIRASGRSGFWRVWTRCAWSSARVLPSRGARTNNRSSSVSDIQCRLLNIYKPSRPIQRSFVDNIFLFAAHWNDISSMDMDLSLFRPVYSPKVVSQPLKTVSVKIAATRLTSLSKCCYFHFLFIKIAVTRISSKYSPSCIPQTKLPRWFILPELQCPGNYFSVFRCQGRWADPLVLCR